MTPESASSLVGLGLSQAPEAPFIRTDDLVLSYGEAQQKTSELYAKLFDAGVGEGDTVILAIDHSVGSVLTLLALLEIGAICSPVAPDVSAHNLHRIVDTFRPRFVIAGDEFLSSLPTSLETEPLDTGISLAGPAEYDDAEERNPDPEDAALVIFTSGSTGDPHGVIHTGFNLAFTTCAIQQRLNYRSSDSIGVFLPLSFDYGLYQVFLALLSGASIYFPAFPLNTPELAKILEKSAVTIFPAVPSLANVLVRLNRRKPTPLPALRMITNTGEHLPLDVIQQLSSDYPEVEIFPMYGLTECKRVSILLPEEFEQRPRSVGRPLDGTTVFTVDDKGRPLPAGESGQLAVRGPHLSPGYWGNPQQTQLKFLECSETGERTLLTGDIGTVDAEGFLFFHSREHSIIKHRGQRISPSEIEEAALSTSGGITQAAAIHDPQSSRLLLYIVADEAVEPAALLTEMKIVLEAFKVPDLVIQRDSLPLTANRKVDRKKLQSELSTPPEIDASAS